MHIHDLVLITARVEVVHRILNDIQPLVARCLQVVLCRQVRPEGACQAGMIAQITALEEKKKGQITIKCLLGISKRD